MGRANTGREGAADGFSEPLLRKRRAGSSAIPKAPSVEGGLKSAAEEIEALVPKCKDSVASAGG
jgi:hypothetical protein